MTKFASSSQPKILDRMILPARCIIGMPQPSYGDEAPPADNSLQQVNLEDIALGDNPPDFSFIDEIEAGGGPKPGTEGGEKPAEEGKEAPKEPAPEPAKKPEDAIAEDIDPAKKPKGEEKPAAEEKKFVLPTDEEIDAMQPKPGASAKYLQDFKSMKEQVLKPAVAKVRELERENEELRARPTLNDDLKNQLERAKEDREWREAFELENDPELQKGFKEKEEATRADLYEVLAKNGMGAEKLETLKKMKAGSEEWTAARIMIIRALKEADDDLGLDEVKDAFRAVDSAEKERNKTLAGLRNKQGDLTKQLSEREGKEREAWAQEAKGAVMEFMPKDDFFALKIAKTDAEKPNVDKHNKYIHEVVVPKVQKGIASLWMRDPRGSIELVFKATKYDEEVKRRQAVEKELTDAKARVTELEGDAGEIRRVASPTPGTGAPKPAQKDESLMSTEEALDAFAKEQGLQG